MPKCCLLVFLFFINIVVSHATPKHVLKADAFQKKLDQVRDAMLIDARSPSEYVDGHIKNAWNVDMNDTSFERNVSKLYKNTPIFIYGLTGKQTEGAAIRLQRAGFDEIYLLDGGMMEWRSAHLPEDNGTGSKETSLTVAEYKKGLVTDKLVLVDFSAPWCGPCKRMAPFVDEIEKEKESTVKIIRINTDENQQLAIDLQIAGLPTVILYKNSQVIWRHVGYANKELLVTTINSIR